MRTKSLFSKRLAAAWTSGNWADLFHVVHRKKLQQLPYEVCLDIQRGENDAVRCQPWAKLPDGQLGISLLQTELIDEACILVGYDSDPLVRKCHLAAGTI